MEATAFRIIDKRRESPFALTSLNDFSLEEIGKVSVDEILGNEHVTLYSLDFDTETAVFVETPSNLDLSQAPFMFIPQYDEAIRVLTISFDLMLELADRVVDPADRLVFIHSIGRCGSTLASQILAQVAGVINLSEPFVLPELVIARNSGTAQKERLMGLLKASILLLCKTKAETAWVIKEHSYCLELADWLYELFPQAKHLFLYRDTATWMESCISAYFGGGMTAEERMAHEASFQTYKAMFIPPVAAIDPNRHLSFVETMSLEWLHYIGRHAKFCEMGLEMLAIRYRDWKKAPQKTAMAMLDYCDCLPDELSAVNNALEQDSQAGTILAQDTVKQRWVLSEGDRGIMDAYLKKHPFINSADYEAQNTLRG